MSYIMSPPATGGARSLLGRAGGSGVTCDSWDWVSGVYDTVKGTQKIGDLEGE